MKTALSVLDPCPSRLRMAGVGKQDTPPEGRLWASAIRRIGLGPHDKDKLLAVVLHADKAEAYERAQAACWALVYGPGLLRYRRPEPVKGAGGSLVGLQLLEWFDGPPRIGILNAFPKVEEDASPGWALVPIGVNSPSEIGEATGLILGWAHEAPVGWRHQSLFLTRRREAHGNQPLKELLEEVTN